MLLKHIFIFFSWKYAFVASICLKNLGVFNSVEDVHLFFRHSSIHPTSIHSFIQSSLSLFQALLVNCLILCSICPILFSSDFIPLLSFLFGSGLEKIGHLLHWDVPLSGPEVQVSPLGVTFDTSLFLTSFDPSTDGGGICDGSLIRDLFTSRFFSSSSILLGHSKRCQLPFLLSSIKHSVSFVSPVVSHGGAVDRSASVPCVKGEDIYDSQEVYQFVNEFVGLQFFYGSKSELSLVAEYFFMGSWSNWFQRCRPKKNGLYNEVLRSFNANFFLQDLSNQHRVCLVSAFLLWGQALWKGRPLVLNRAA